MTFKYESSSNSVIHHFDGGDHRQCRGPPILQDRCGGSLNSTLGLLSCYVRWSFINALMTDDVDDEVYGRFVPAITIQSNFPPLSGACRNTAQPCLYPSFGYTFAVISTCIIVFEVQGARYCKRPPKQRLCPPEALPLQTRKQHLPASPRAPKRFRLRRMVVMQQLSRRPWIPRAPK